MIRRFKDAQELKLHILACLQNGHIQEALASCDQLRRTAPLDGEAWLLLGNLKLRLGQPDDALACCEQAAQLRPDLADPHILTGNIHKSRKEYAAAVSCYQRALAILPEHPGVLNNLGNTLALMDQFPDAASCYRRALRKSPDYAEAWNNLGSALRKQHKPEDAIECFTRALEIKPDYAVAHNNLGNALKDHGNTEDAIRSYQAALQLNPRYVDAYINMGTALKKMQKFDEAMKCYRQAIHIDPDNYGAHLNMGNICQEMNQLETAYEHYRKAAREKPDSIEAWKSLGAIMLKQGNRDAAIEHYQQALQIGPGDKSAQYMRAVASGETPPDRAPAEYIRELFDYYSDQFDNHLTGNLEYRTPEHVHRLVLEALETGKTDLDILDLGCGTGLCGSLFRSMAGTLTGVDLSSGMLAKAATRNVYDRLLTGDISNPPLGKAALFDLILATDVFIYIGGLTEIFRDCHARLRSGGLFSFSTESATDERQTFILGDTGRYAHTPTYIHELAAATGFTIINQSSVTLRLEKSRPVPGHIYVLRKQLPHDVNQPVR